MFILFFCLFVCLLMDLSVYCFNHLGTPTGSFPESFMEITGAKESLSKDPVEKVTCFKCNQPGHRTLMEGWLI